MSSGAPSGLSTSRLFSRLNDTFESDCCALEDSIRRLKEQPKKKVCYKNEAPLSSQAKELRNMTEQRFSEIIAGWKRQNANLEGELANYKSQQRKGAERLVKRNDEIKKLRDENEKLSSILRQCETRIHKLQDAREKEKAEQMRADRLAQQLFEHKSMVKDIQSQLTEAERQLESARMERESLAVELGELKNANFCLRGRLEDAEKDTKETKLELEMIEDLVQSVNTGAGGCCANVREVPSALTALNILRKNHDNQVCKLNNQVKKLKKRDNDKTEELERLRRSFCC